MEDTLFRLVSTHSDQSRNSSRTTTSSSPSNYHHRQDQQCFLYMDQDLSSSSSSSKHDAPTCSTTPTRHDHDVITMDFSAHNMCVSDILLETSRAIADNNSARVHHLFWMLNELSSPYGDVDQKLASYFLQALFALMTDSGQRTYRSLLSAAERNCSFDSTRQMLLKFQEVSPWTMFGHVASNGAIMEAVGGETRIHIIDVSNTYCTQWPTLLEAIATRADETPHLKLTTVVRSGVAAAVMREIGCRMEKFARLMGVPFEFRAVHHAADLSELDLSELEIKQEEAIVVNCVAALRSVRATGNNRDSLISIFRRLEPRIRILTVVEEEADFNVGVEFVRGFEECLRWFRVYFESLDDCFPKTSNERLMLERAAGRAVVDLVACPPSESVERRDTAARWSQRLHAGGFSAASFTEEVCDDVRSLLRRYEEGWSMGQCSDAAGIFLSWKERPVVWASAWKPC